MAAADDTRVLILTGPPGAGKNAVAALLAGRRERAVHLESDFFFNAIRSGFVEPWRPEPKEQNEVVMRVVAGAAAGYAAGYFTIVDGIVLPRFFFEPLRDALLAEGHDVAYAVLRAPLEVCVSRAEAREARPLGERGVAERLWHDFAELGALERHAVDLAGEGPEEAADLPAARLGDGSLRLDSGPCKRGPPLESGTADPPGHYRRRLSRGVGRSCLKRQSASWFVASRVLDCRVGGPARQESPCAKPFEMVY